MAYGKTIGKNLDNKEARQTWRTPRKLFDELHKVFGFTVDACASPENALLPKYWTEADDCRLQAWTGERVFCNPPFAKIATILPKAEEADLALFLIPASGLTTRYVGKTTPGALLVPNHRIKFLPPEELQGKPFSPSLGTILALYGEATPGQLKEMSALGFMVFTQAA